MAESKEELKSLLLKMKEESEKVGLKLNIQKMKIMASGPITSWEIDGETVSDFIFLGSKITTDGNCSHEIKRRLLLGRKVMTNLDSILKSRDITLPTKVHLVKAMVFVVVMHGCESWTIKKPERRRIDAFELWCWRRLLSLQGNLPNPGMEPASPVLPALAGGFFTTEPPGKPPYRLSLQDNWCLSRPPNSSTRTIYITKYFVKQYFTN